MSHLKVLFSSKSQILLAKWGLVSVLAGGDVSALLLFSAIGRYSHGFSVFDFETFKTADPFIAGWFLSAYFLGGYGEDGRRMNGLFKAVFAAAKSWAVGVPLGLIIRAATIGHTPPTNFILVTMGSTAILLIGWRTLLFSIFPANNGKKDDAYKRGNPFELFEVHEPFDLITSCTSYCIKFSLRSLFWFLIGARVYFINLSRC